MQFRTGTMDDVARLWALRTRCVREICSSHYPPEVIAPWSASPPPSQYARLLSQGGCVVAEDGQGVLLGFGVFDTDANEVDALFVDPDRGGKGIGQALMQRLLAMADRDREVVLSASLNAVPFYQRHGFISVREETYPHPSGVALASVSMRRPW
ncbi:MULTISPECIES: GNAT family N-acetyltransferase [Stenotrophomonas]|jgi:GNAT superfamily N-acetyltransferase|uniref:GNAT family N-acetyltransferase n=1 Tax=Stenotrophomonas TaxID=40323 RepID=UPI001042E435|nr:MULTISPECIES: GNAT family N-acetyltransferase [Stenotrophomonas]MBD3739531.1 GNAT family N-acetyltransferase [Stenotrophomonas sp.]MBN4994909.1 GNAT family N-acetyltransferase [Stenotrophomonas maltophilia]MCO7498721.1 GNAT family N-acetyltransferase [Stenotrophomonas maltophilia]QBL40321.1 GNAT family N-acetyltransferase [Stenotrophomonas sp. ASS1]